MARNTGGNKTTNPLEVARYKEFAYLVGTGMSMTKAHNEVGMSSATAVKLMRDEKVLAYIQEVRTELEEEFKITRKDVIKGMIRAVRQADIQGEPMTQIAGWREIGKMEGMYAPQQHEHTVNGEIHHMDRDLRSKSTSELEKILEQNGGDIVDGEYTECQEDGTG